MEEVRVEEIVEFISKLVQEKNFRELRSRLDELYPMDIAEAFDELPPRDCVVTFRVLKKDKAADVFSYMSTQRRKDIVGAINDKLLGFIIDELNFDDLIDFLEEMPANFVKSAIAAVPAEERGLINQFLNYKDNSAGSLMTIEYVDLDKNLTVRQALDRIKAVGMDKETVYTCYVLDDTRGLEGNISLRKLVLSEEDMLISEIMNRDCVRCETADDQEEVADLFKRYDLIAIPVVDAENRMIGIITIDDIVDVIEEENTEDFLKMAAIAPSDEGYMETRAPVLAKRRIPWLMVLMISAIFTGSIIGYYEDLLSTMAMLAIFIPLLMDTAGNAGAQSSTLVIRGIALGEIERRDLPKVIWKELRVGLIAGAALAAVNFLLRFIIFGDPIVLIITVNATLILTVVIAKLLGCMLPVVADFFKMDPAVMSAPLITTIADALALLLYFGIASVLIFGL